ncbi:mesenchyme-specific cell surface glycoprotein-like isoform X1 [Pomacea canaliculata]|nr:mesenchyme-specific cell surface glycoprotein-like isoform X1 [Pomacea canaliculata]
MEPTNVIVSPNGLMAYVALPRNNAVARINLDTNLVSTIYPLGNRSWNSYYLDPSDYDLGVNMRRYNAHSTYQARQVRWVVQNNTEWIITLDAGFVNEIPEYDYADWRRGKELLERGVIETTDSNLRAQLADDTQLGRAAISIEDGIVSTSPLRLENVFLFGGRGISIRDSNTFQVRTTLVDNIERVAAQTHPEIFNGGFTNPSHSPQQDRDATSPFLGPNLSTIESGYYNGNIVMFVGSATAGIIYVYVLSPDANCPQPYFHSAFRLGSTFSSWTSLTSRAPSATSA